MAITAPYSTWHFLGLGINQPLRVFVKLTIGAVHLLENTFNKEIEFSSFIHYHIHIHYIQVSFGSMGLTFIICKNILNISRVICLHLKSALVAVLLTWNLLSHFPYSSWTIPFLFLFLHVARLSLNWGSSCLSLPRAGITGMYYHI